jgi:hypothetical protein
MDTNENTIVLNAITVGMIQESVNYMNDEEIILTSEELDEMSEELQDAVMDVITQFINSRS